MEYSDSIKFQKYQVRLAVELVNAGYDVKRAVALVANSYGLSIPDIRKLEVTVNEETAKGRRAALG